MTRQQVWQGILDWFRPAAQTASVSHQVLTPEGAFSGDALTAAEFFAEEAVPELDDRDLAEFLAADYDPIPADSEFRDRLREELWAMVEDGTVARRKDH